jgi:hypothetical protein
MMLRWWHGLLRRLRRVNLNWCVHGFILVIQTHRWSTHSRIDSATHAWNANAWRWFFRRCHLKNSNWFEIDWKVNDVVHLQSDTSIEREFDWIWVVACLHESRKVADSNLFKRRLSSARVSLSLQALSQWTRSSQENVVVNLNKKKNWWSIDVDVLCRHINSPSASCFVLVAARLAMDCLEVKVNLILLSLMVVHEGSDNHFAFDRRPCCSVRFQIHVSS